MTEDESSLQEFCSSKLSAQTRVFHRGSDDYEIHDCVTDYQRHAYQYAKTSHECKSMAPAAIIYPRNVTDIQKIVRYADDNDLGIAVRTGGHQYSGASSTSGRNIQLDLSDTFDSVAKDFRYNHSTNLLRVGISFSVFQLQSLLRNMKMFVPHGLCGNVHLGGHVQTGGVGMICRSFGLMCDYVEGFEIVLANAEHVKIWRPNSSYPTETLHPENDDLYWAVLGGSPGNYGILTHLYMRTLKDEDYPDSHIMKIYSRYSKEKHEKCLQLFAELSDQVDLPRNFDYCLTTVMQYHVHGKGEERTLDEKMAARFPDQYGDGLTCIERALDSNPNRKLPLILILFQWTNVNGSEEQFGEEEIAWFEKIREGVGPDFCDAIEINAFEESEIYSLDTKVRHPNDTLTPPHSKQRGMFRKSLATGVPPEYKTLEYTKPTPISEMMRYQMWDYVREFPQPVQKRTYFTNRMDLSTNGWVKEIADVIDDFMKKHDDDFEERLNFQLQMFAMGGENSMFRKIAVENPQNSSHSWRNELTAFQAMDVFYDSCAEGALDEILKWQEENDKIFVGDGGKFCERDLRMLWGSYGRVHDDEEGGANLELVWDKYYDSKEKYDKLVDIKRKVDPKYIFTANAFGVDANNAPVEKRPLVVPNGYEKDKTKQEVSKSKTIYR